MEETSILRANSESIKKLFSQSGYSDAQIAEKANVTRMSVFNVRTNRVSMDKITFSMASALTHVWELYQAEHWSER